MLADLFMALWRGLDQLTYWAHTYLPFNRWRRATDVVIATAGEEAARYGIRDAAIDRRRAYQVARMIVANRRGEHLSDVVPDAYGEYAPTCRATTQSGKTKFVPRAERREAFRRHPQTLAYLLTPAALARLGVGYSEPGTVVGVNLPEPTPPTSAVASRLRKEMANKGGCSLDVYATIVVRLHSGPAHKAEEEVEAA